MQMLDWARLQLLCKHPQLQQRTELERFPSHIVKAIQGTEKYPPEHAKDIYEEVFLAWMWVKNQGKLEAHYCEDLEQRAQEIPVLWPIATRIHISQSVEREIKARATLSVQQIPFSLPNVLDPIQVEVIAAGEVVLNALHVDWVRKLAKHTLDAFALDCRYLGLWFEPILDTLPENLLRKALRKIPRARKLQPGSLGLAAYYAWRLNVPTDPYLRKATEIDHAFFQLACEVSK